MNKSFSFLKPGMTVLDLGAGDGRYARLFHNHGCHVVCVDVKERPIDLPMDIEWKKQHAVDFASENTQLFDFIFCSHMIQFLKKERVFDTLFPKIQKSLKKGGRLLLKTFFNQPIPAFKQRQITTFTANELTDNLKNCEIIFAKEMKKKTNGLDGQIRTFFLTIVFAKKK